MLEGVVCLPRMRPAPRRSTLTSRARTEGGAAFERTLPRQAQEESWAAGCTATTLAPVRHSGRGEVSP